MSECKYFNALNMKSTCRLCLRTTKDVYAMSSKESSLYRSFVNNKITNVNWDMYVCIFCGWTLKKIQKFVDQCQETNEMLTQIVDMDSKSLIFLHKLYVNLSVSKTETHDYRSCDTDYDDKNDIDTMFDNDNDNDDVPLMMLTDNFRHDNAKKKRRKKKSKVIFKGESQPDYKSVDTNNIEQELDIDLKGYSKAKRRKAVREGFTSKMVQETSEYVVIKLTKEQVLQEMQAKSGGEAYCRAPYKCAECVKGFNFEDVLLNHMEKHTSKPGYLQCGMCSQYCPTAVSLRGHIKSHTTRYRCKLCGHTRLSRQHLLEHHALAHTSAATTYTCDHCRFTTNKRTVIQRHVKSHVPTESHACDKCGKLFKNINSLRVHTIRHDKSKRLRCDQCNKVFIIPSLLHKHVRSVHERKDYYCVECDVRFKSPETMRLHFKRAKRHQDPSSYKCVTVGARPHECSVCARSYSSRAALRAHTHRAHTHKKQHLNEDLEIATQQET